MGSDPLQTTDGGAAPLGAAARFVLRDACDDCGLLREADHRIANHLALLMGYVRLKTLDLKSRGAEPTVADTRLVLEDVNVQIGAVARLHTLLTAHGRCASPDLSHDLHEICTALRLGIAGAIDIREDLQPDCLVAPDQILPLVRCVAEVVTNAVKHARSGDEAGAILVRCRKDDSGTLWIEVIDDGVGLPQGFDPEVDGGLGFRLIRAFGRQLHAIVAFNSSDRGLAFRLVLPGAQDFE
jgi:two-component sensor histidine kinase